MKRSTRAAFVQLLWLTLMTIAPAAPSPAVPATVDPSDRRGGTRYAPIALTLPVGDAGITLDAFHRVGGDGASVTPTVATVTADAEALRVEFRCDEPSDVTWATERHEGRRAVFAFADRVEVFVRPTYDAERFLLVAAASNGRFAYRWSQRVGEVQASDEGTVRAAGPTDAAGSDEEPSDPPTVSLERSPDGWVATVEIPWSLLGGRPTSPFGLNVARFRHQSAEYTSPMGNDHTYYPPQPNPVPNQFMEVTLTHKTVEQPLRVDPSPLATLPTGVRFWQRPAVLRFLTVDEHRWLADGLSDSSPTTAETLDARIALTQRLHDLLAIEGFSFNRISRTWAMTDRPDYNPRAVRARANRAMREGDLAAAAKAVDEAWTEYGEITRHWYADGTPGNVSDDWAAWAGPLGVTHDGDGLSLAGTAGGRDVTLRLTLPESGGVRLTLGDGGDVRPIATIGLEGRVSVADDATSVRLPGGTIVVDPGRQDHDWRIELTDEANRSVWSLTSGGIRLRFGVHGSVEGVDVSHPLGDGRVFGFGEWADRLDHRGNVLTLWQQDAWESHNGGLRNHSYKTIPFYLSAGGPVGGGYAVFANTTYRTRADVGSTDPETLRLTSHGDVLDLYVWPHASLVTVRAFNRLTDNAPYVMTRWAFEPWAGGGWLRWRQGPLKNGPMEQIAAAERFATLDIPHAAFYAEGEGSADPRVHDALNRLGLRVLTWTRNDTHRLPPQPGGRVTPDEDLPVLRRPDGSVYRPGEVGRFVEQFPYLDFTHPDAQATWERMLAARLDLGIAGTMVDFGDWVPEDAVAHDGTRGDRLHNAYALGYHRTIRAIFDKRRGTDHAIFARQAAPGSGKYVAYFGGDHLTNFHGMKASLVGALGFAACGFSNWSVELAGYSGGWPDSETYQRWTAWSCFAPLMRCHGQTPREPWEYGERSIEIYRKFAWVRHNLLDTLHALAAEAHDTATPLMRPLPLAYPDEPSLAGVDDQYLLGPDLLVCPILTPGGRRTILVPPGRWTDLWTGEVTQGPKRQEVVVEDDGIPVYLREGALLPVHLAGNFRWGQSLTNDRVAAIVLTPPTDDAPTRALRIPDASGLKTASTVSLSPTGDGFSVLLTNRPQTRFLLIGGLPEGRGIVAVTADGEPLRLAHRPHARPVGFWHNTRDRRWVIRLPHGTNDVTVTLGAAGE